MKKGLIIGVVVVVLLVVAVAAFMLMGGEEDKKTGPGPAGPAPPPPNPCAGLTDDSLASSVSVECLRKHLRDEGCNETGTVWPQDDYNGWWRQSPQGTTTVGCDNQGTPCGAGNYATVKSDIHAWATLTDPDHVRGCKGPPPSTFSYVGDGQCTNDSQSTVTLCKSNSECDYIGQQSNGCWHLLKSGGAGKTPSAYPRSLMPVT